MAEKTWALILAGGDGTRLQGLTRAITGRPMPKQYCRLLGTKSLLQATLERTRNLVEPERTLVVVNRNHLAEARDQLRELPTSNILVQPRNLDTGPGLLFGLLHLTRRDAQARVAVFPSDHFVDDDAAFISHVRGADDFVSRSARQIALLGVCPAHADTGYGYIEPGLQITSGSGERIYRVAGFHEKPSSRRAKALKANGAFWNAFVLVGSVGRFLDLLQQVRPRETQALSILQRDPLLVNRIYHHLQPWNFSRDFLALVPSALVVLAVDDVEWSDWGTPDSIARTLEARTPHAAWRPLEQALRSVDHWVNSRQLAQQLR